VGRDAGLKIETAAFFLVGRCQELDDDHAAEKNGFFNLFSSTHF
jgi:hypothetical protein